MSMKRPAVEWRESPCPAEPVECSHASEGGPPLPRNTWLSEREVEVIAEDQAEKVFDTKFLALCKQMGLVRDREPDLVALGAFGRWYRKWLGFWDRIILAAIPIGLGLLVANWASAVAFFQAIFGKGDAP